MKRLKILIWHVHGSYLYYLTQSAHEFYLPFKKDRRGDYIGKFGHLPWGENVHDVPAEEVMGLDLDCIIFQLPHQFLKDQHEILSDKQRRLAKIYLQHDTPAAHPTDAKHIVDDPSVLLVHVTDFNRLMWDSGQSPTRVIDHGVIVREDIRYTGELEKGIVVINHLGRRGRMLGCDIYQQVRKEVRLDLVGMGAEEMPGGRGEVLHKDLSSFEAKYRFFFNPIRYTSFPLALCEAMAIGMPVVALATTEVSSLPDGVVGHISTSPQRLVEGMKELLKDRRKACRLGENARTYAQERFNIKRFIRDWDSALEEALSLRELAYPKEVEPCTSR